MEKNEFISQLRQLVGERLFAEESALSIDIRDITKNNGVIMSGMIIKSPETNIAPTIYLDSYYDAYINDQCTLDECVENICNCYSTHKLSESMDIDFIRDFKAVKELLFPCICSTVDNVSFLEGHPHKEVLDLSIYYRILLNGNTNAFGGDATIAVTNELLNTWDDISVVELDEAAWCNAKVITPAVFSSMAEVLTGMFSSIPDDFPSDEMLGSLPMYILSNKSKTNGAVWMVNTELLSTIASQLGNDLYILGSSRHESIILPASSDTDVDSLRDMVVTVNSTEVSAEDKLSDSVYFFNNVTKELSIA